MRNRLKYIIISVVVVLAAVVVWLTPARSFVLHVGGNITTPVFSFFNGIGNGISDWFSYMKESKVVFERNKALLDEIEQLQNKLDAYAALEEENKRLSDLLSLDSDFSDIPSTGAEIIAREAGNWFTVFTINKGQKHGIQKNQPVLCNGGLVGHTTDVGANWAKVVTLIDTNHSVSGTVARSGDYVQIDGDITLMGGGMCKMTVSSDRADVIVGDTLLSSGIGGVYPPGIIIGTVAEFKSNADNTGSYAVVNPAVDFSSVHTVLVLQTEPEVLP